MALLQRLIPILILFCIDQTTRAFKIQNTTREWNLGRRYDEIIFSQPPIENELSFAYCCGSESERFCKFIMENRNKSNVYVQPCGMCTEVTLKSSSEKALQLHQYVLTSLGSDRLIFMWAEGIIDQEYFSWKQNTPSSNDKSPSFLRASLRTYIIDKRECKTYEAAALTYQSADDLPDLNSIDGVSVVTYEDTYDLFYRNTLLCGEKRCRATFNSEGKQINGPVAFLPSQLTDQKVNVYPVASHTPVKGFFVLRNFFVDYSLELVDTIGDRVMLRNYSRIYGDNQMGSSSSCEMFGICIQTHTEHLIECLQFDAKGRKQLSADLYLNTSDIKMYNLKAGGFALLTRYEDTKFTVSKIYPDGRQGELFKISERVYCKPETLIRVDFTEMNGDGFCLMFVCQTQTPVSQIKYIQICFN